MDSETQSGQPTNLSSYIQSQGYQTDGGDGVQSDADAQSALRQYLGDGEPSSGETGDVAADGTEGGGEEPTTPQPQPWLAEKLRLEAERDNARREVEYARGLFARLRGEQLRLQEEQFMASLANEDDATRAQKLLTYREGQWQQERQGYQTALQQRDQSDGEIVQELAKTEAAFKIAAMHGIPTEYVGLIKKARTGPEMFEIAQQLQGMSAAKTQQARQQTRQERISSGVDVAGGERAGSPPPQMPKKRSGDIKSLIAMTQYQNVPMFTRRQQ